MLDLLRDRPHDAGEFVAALGVSQPTASKHLRALREAGLVRVTGIGQRRVYSIDTAPLAALDEWLAPYRALWNASLDALGCHLDNEIP
jgi:DNA-binding transcriptional ArsR family regulator